MEAAINLANSRVKRDDRCRWQNKGEWSKTTDD